MKTISLLASVVLCGVSSLLAQPATTNPISTLPVPKRPPRVAMDATPTANPAEAVAAPASTNITIKLPAPAQANPDAASGAATGAVQPATAAAAVPSIPVPPPIQRRPRPASMRTNAVSIRPADGTNPAAIPALPNPADVNPSVAPAAVTPAVPPTVNPAAVPPRPATVPIPAVAGMPADANAAAAGAAALANPANTNALAAAAAPVAEELLPPGLLKFNDAELTQVLELYQDLTGKTILRPSSLPATKISMRSQTPLTRTEAVQAMDSILSMNGISMVPSGDKFVKALPEAQIGTSGMKFYGKDTDTLPEAGVPVATIVRITNALPGDVAKALQPFAKAPNSILAIDAANVLVLRDYAENIKRMMEIIAKIDVVPVDEIKSVVIPIKYALASDIAQVLSSLTAGGGGATTVGRQTTRSGLTMGGGGGMGGMGGMGGIGGMGNTGYNPNALPGQAGYGGAGGGLSGGGLTSPGASRSSFASRLNAVINKAAGTGDIVVLNQTKIIADERTNSLLIFASRQDMTSISNIIAQLDVVLAQVLIEALIFEVSLNNTLNYGVSYLQRQPSQSGNFTGIGALMNNLPGGGTFISPSTFTAIGTNGSAGGGLPGGFSYAGRFGNDLDVAASAVAGDSRFNVLSRPRIQTSHAVEANLFVGRTRPYPTGTGYGGYGGYGYGGGYSQIQQLQIGITLSVLPLINVDGLVVMDIRQRTQSVGQDIEIANVGKVPETIDREANAKVAVRNHETIVLGGFISSENKKSASGIPLLKDIPILGNLFRSTSKSQDKQELMVLIRPTVLPTPTDAAAVVADERKAMPGVARAERENLEEERKRARVEDREAQKRAQAEAKELLKREGFKN